MKRAMFLLYPIFIYLIMSYTDIGYNEFFQRDLTESKPSAELSTYDTSSVFQNDELRNLSSGQILTSRDGKLVIDLVSGKIEVNGESENIVTLGLLDDGNRGIEIKDKDSNQLLKLDNNNTSIKWGKKILTSDSRSNPQNFNINTSKGVWHSIESSRMTFNLSEDAFVMFFAMGSPGSDDVGGGNKAGLDIGIEVDGILRTDLTTAETNPSSLFYVEDSVGAASDHVISLSMINVPVFLELESGEHTVVFQYRIPSFSSNSSMEFYSLKYIAFSNE